MGLHEDTTELFLFGKLWFHDNTGAVVIRKEVCPVGQERLDIYKKKRVRLVRLRFKELKCDLWMAKRLTYLSTAFVQGTIVAFSTGRLIRGKIALLNQLVDKPDAAPALLYPTNVYHRWIVRFSASLITKEKQRSIQWSSSIRQISVEVSDSRVLDGWSSDSSTTHARQPFEVLVSGRPVSMTWERVEQKPEWSLSSSVPRYGVEAKKYT